MIAKHSVGEEQTRNASGDPIRRSHQREVAKTAAPSSAKEIAARENFASAWKTETRPIFAEFKQWTENYLASDAAVRPTLLGRGLKLAHARREEMSQLIEVDPQQAIASAVPRLVRGQLPEQIKAQLEHYVSGQGELGLIGVTPGPGQKNIQPYFRAAVVNGQHYRAFVYGRRNTQSTKVDISILGVALDGKLAVSESPLRLLEPGEIAAPGQPVNFVCPISGKVTPTVADEPLNTKDATAVEVAGEIHQLCSASHVSDYEQRLIKGENAAGPYSGALTLGDSGPGSSGVVDRPPLSWSQGAKKILIIRVDFSDLPGTPTNPFDGQTITEDYVANRFNSGNGVRDYYVQSSYNKTTLVLSPTSGGDSPDVTDVLRMPNTASSYALGYSNTVLHADARALATQAGYNMANYDRIGVVFSYLGNIPGSQINYGGLGNVQGSNFWINGYFTFSTVAHEIGHTYGLVHANYWKVSDGNPVSASGSSIEYGDIFDVMGDGDTFQNQFNHWEKSLLQWIPDSAVTTISSPGTYRVYRFDHASANLANALALKIVRDSMNDYWIGFRQAITGSSSLMNGAYILWGWNTVQQSALLDFNTPGSNTNDAPLAIGATFNDTAAGITIQPLAKGGTSPNEYLDVQVSFQPRIQWASTNYTFDEQLGSATLTLLRSGSSSGAVTVNYSTVNGTAVAPGDYTATSGSVTWTNGDMAQKTISVPIAADSSSEGVENFTVRITSISGGVVVESTNATVNIADSGAFDGTLDEDFVNNTVYQSIVQPDGKILICGAFSAIQVAPTFASYTRSGFARLNANGTLDVDFGNGSGADVVPINTMALQPDGKVLIAGNFTSIHGVSRTRIARLNSDGSLDTTFNPGTGPDNQVVSIALQPDGKILIGGYFSNVQGTSRSFLARLNADGSLDTSFAAVPFVIDGNSWRVEALAIQPDNKILAGGSFYFSGSPFKAGIVRLNTNGTVDSSFNPGAGAHLNGNPNSLRSVLSISLQRDGNIIIGGAFTGYNNTNRNYIARISSTGVLDTTFNPSADNTVYGTLVQADGKILVGGNFTTISATALNRFARLNSSGALDTAFDVGSGSTARVTGFAMQPDGKVLISSAFATVKGVTERTVSRLYAGLPGLSGTVQFTSSTFSGAEGGSAALIVSRTGGSYGTMSVNYATITGTASGSDFTTNIGTLSWTNGETTSKTISVALTYDGVAESDETFNVNLGVPIGGAFISSPGYTTVTITTAYNLWKSTYFTPIELLDSAVSGDSADPDGDGLINVAEYAAGKNPKSFDAIGKPQGAIQSVTGTNYLTMSFRRSTFTPDLAYTPQATGLVNASFTNGPVQVGSPVNNGDGTETVTWRDTVPKTSATQRYMRLQIQRTP